MIPEAPLYLSLVAKKDWEGFAITFVTRHNDDLKNLQQTSRSVGVSVPRASWTRAVRYVTVGVFYISFLQLNKQEVPCSQPQLQSAAGRRSEPDLPSEQP